IVPPIKAILESPDLRLSGFLGPGHVSTVVGTRPSPFLSEEYRKPKVGGGWVRAAGQPRVGAHAASADPRRPLRDRKPVHAGGAPGGQHPGAEVDVRDVRTATALRMAWAGVHFAERTEGSPRLR